MKKLLVLVLCAWFTGIWAQEYPAPAGEQSIANRNPVRTDEEMIQFSVVSEPSWKLLERMELAERENSAIIIDLPAGVSSKALNLARQIETMWNSGQFDQALADFNDLSQEVNWKEISIGRTWRLPLTNPQRETWGPDVRIGTRDSIRTVAFDIHRGTGNLFAVFLFHERTQDLWSVNYSSDGGETWYETFSWWASYTLNSLNAVIVGDYCYVGFSRGSDQNQAFLYRFSVYDGSQTNFSTGLSYHTVFTTTSPVYIKEVALSANQDYFNNRLYYSAILSDGTLKFFWGLDPEFVTWIEVITNVTTASRGLDITSNQNYTNYYQWVSYIDNSNLLRIDGVTTSDTWAQLLNTAAGASSDQTAIGAYGDTITCAFEYTGDRLYNKYWVSYNGGTTWAFGFLDDTLTVNETPNLTARYGGGVAMVYRFYTPIREGRYKWRLYRGTWTTPEAFTDYAPYYVQPAIEYLGNGDYGVVYLSWNSPYRQAAYFDRLLFTLNAPQNLYAMGGYHNSILLTWELPLEESQPSLLNSPAQQVQLPREKVTTENPVELSKPSVKHSPGSGGADAKVFSSTVPQTNPRHTEADLLSFNVYRSTSMGGPYTLIANVDKQYYRDLSVNNSQTYYYVVQAVYDVGTSGYSNETSGMAILNGYVINSAHAITSPTIDGVINSAEWSQATATVITSTGMTYPVMLYSMNDLNYLYLALDDLNNTVPDDYDEFGIYFDENHDYEWPASSPSIEGNFWIDHFIGSPVTSRFRGISGVWPSNLVYDSAIDDNGVISAVSFSTGHIQFEVKIDLVASNLNLTPGNGFGVYLFSYDVGSYNFNGSWPEQVFNYWNLPASYGTLILDPVVGIEQPNENTITAYELLPNYPNPFNPSTTIRYRLANTQAQPTTLTIYSSSGQLIRTLVNEEQNNGEYAVTWDGLNAKGEEVGSGVYFFQLKSGDFTQTQKLVKMK